MFPYIPFLGTCMVGIHVLQCYVGRQTMCSMNSAFSSKLCYSGIVTAVISYV